MAFSRRLCSLPPDGIAPTSDPHPIPSINPVRIPTTTIPISEQYPTGLDPLPGRIQSIYLLWDEVSCDPSRMYCMMSLETRLGGFEGLTTTGLAKYDYGLHTCYLLVSASMTFSRYLIPRFGPRDQPTCPFQLPTGTVHRDYSTTNKLLLT